MCGVLSLRPAAAEGAAPIPANVVLLADDGIVEPPPIARDDLEHFHGSPPVIRCRPPASHAPTKLVSMSCPPPRCSAAARELRTALRNCGDARDLLRPCGPMNSAEDPMIPRYS